MQREIIGEAAGQVWEALGAKEEVGLAQLPRLLKLKTEVAYQALGWLAREEKIEYRTRGDKVYISLTESERQSYNHARRPRESALVGK